jgi:hypothetical protein
MHRPVQSIGCPEAPRKAGSLPPAVPIEPGLADQRDDPAASIGLAGTIALVEEASVPLSVDQGTAGRVGHQASGR